MKKTSLIILTGILMSFTSSVFAGNGEVGSVNTISPKRTSVEPLLASNPFYDAELIIETSHKAYRDMKIPTQDLQKLFPKEGEIEFTRDIVFQPDRYGTPDGNYPSSDTNTSGYLGNYGNNAYYLKCDFNLVPDAHSRRYLEKRTKIKVDSLDIQYSFDFFGNAYRVLAVKINFKHAILKNMTCTTSDGFTGYKSLNLTRKLIIKGSSSFMTSSSFLDMGEKL